MNRRTSSALVKACLNGSRTRAEPQTVPMSPTELAVDARLAVGAGAAALHVHPRRENGAETLDPGACAAATREIRAVCPGVPVGLSTGFWIEGDPARRLSCVAAWTVLPDFVSVNFSEPGTVELCKMLISRQIGVEAGVWTVADAEAFVASGLSERCLRVLFEPREEKPEEALATADAIAGVLDRHGIRLPRLLHGEGAATWPVLDASLLRGYGIRIGFEDTLHLPDGRLAQHNGELVATAVLRVRAHESKRGQA